MDDKFHIHGIIVIFREVSIKWNFIDQTTSFNLGWTWFTCNHINIKANMTIMVRHDNITTSYLISHTTYNL
jgi:hypothetical protein